MFILVDCTNYDGQRLAQSPAEGALCGNGRLDPFETCDERIAPGQPDACPLTCDPGADPCEPRVLVGDACQKQCAPVPVRAARSGDGCCPTGADADATNDSDCGGCGDGIIGPRETCDPPESCPREETCTSELSCVSTEYSGAPEQCNAVCELRQGARCGAEDGCCPANCSAGRDGDCSNACGDGFIDADAGELCEPGEGEGACPTDCDDRDPCSTDIQVGRAENCNVACMHRPITQRRSGDGCCPPQTTFLVDRDCGRCGNGRVEGSEECDGGEDCEPDCTLRRARAALVHRYDFGGTGTTIRDLVGDADAAIVNASLRGEGELRLPADGESYVELPSGIISSRSSASFEIWVTWHGDGRRRFERIFDFGDSKDGRTEASTLFFSPNYDESGAARLHFQVGNEPARLTPTRTLPVDRRVQLVVVFDSEQQSMRVYLDGQAAGGEHWPYSLSDLPDVNNWLGRSQYYSRDPGLWATLHEFRIYAGPLSGSAIEASYENGPDVPN